MPYAITLRFDQKTEGPIAKVRADLSGILNGHMQASDFYSPHITLAIFENLALSSLDVNIRNVAAKACELSVEFCGLGLFESSSGFTLFLPVVPSISLIRIHEALHHQFVTEKRRDNYYDVGKWLPHCTIASGVSASVPIGRVFSLLPKEMLYQSVEILRIEVIFTADVALGSLETLRSIPLRM